jgi:hypothetical protein
MKTMILNSLEKLQDLAFNMPYSLSESEKELLSDIYYESLEDLDEPEAMFTYAIAKAIRKHLEQTQSNEHIYLQKFEIPQIRLFELLIQQFPLANLSQHCVNTLLVDAICKHQNPVLMDIGIGTGMQVSNIIEGLIRKQNSSIKTLTIVGIEPYGDALVACDKNIENISQKAGFEVKLITKEAFIEKMSLAEIKQLLPAKYDSLYINASFALHHIQTADDRKMVFENLKKLQANAFVLSEPNSNHYEKFYPKRFANCVNHYGTLFKIIDTLPILNNEKAALKLFFSREIDDVLGNAEDVRVEKHYATKQWIKLFEETGFELQKPTAEFDYDALNGTILQTNLPNRYATTFNEEEITSLFWAK